MDWRTSEDVGEAGAPKAIADTFPLARRPKNLSSSWIIGLIAILCTLEPPSSVDNYCLRYLPGARNHGEPKSCACHIGFRCVKDHGPR